jgi:hypothetical protein
VSISGVQEFSLGRLIQNSYATYGHLLDVENRIVCCTVERPWLNNANDISCVPAGSYLCHRYFSPKHQRDVFMLGDVPGRTNIEIHIANLPTELLGCIALGLHFGEVTNKRGDHGHGVLESEPAFDAFMALLAGEQVCRLTITDPSRPLAAAA